MNSALAWTLGAVIAVTLISTTGVSAPPWAGWWEIVKSGQLLDALGFFGYYAVVIWLFARPGWRSGLPMLALGFGAALVHGWLLSQNLLPALARAHYVTLPGLWVGGLCLFSLAAGATSAEPTRRSKSKVLFLAALLPALFGLVVQPLLNPSAVLHPATYDAVAFHLDQALGFQPSVAAAALARETPGLEWVLQVVYLLMPFGMAVVYGDQLARPDGGRVNVMYLWIWGVAFSVLAYHLCPISGPRYAFSRAFPSACRNPLACRRLLP